MCVVNTRAEREFFPLLQTCWQEDKKDGFANPAGSDFADAGDGHGSNAFLPPHKAQTFVGGGFDADLVGLDAQSSGDFFLHCRGVWIHLGRFSDEGGVNVLNAHAFVSGDLGALFEDLKAADTFDAWIGRREPVADVRLAKSAEHRIGDGVAQHICIRVAFEAARMRDGDATEDEEAASFKGMYVVTDACANHGESGVVVCGFLQAGEHVGDFKIDALAVEKVANVFITSFGQMVQAGDEMFANAHRAV